jgi:hypothetical protein
MLNVTPPARAGALAALASALLGQGRAVEALASAREATALLESLGGIEEFESLVSVALVEALVAAGEIAEARKAAAAARARLDARSIAIQDGARRASFLGRVPENARIVELCRELGVATPSTENVP